MWILGQDLPHSRRLFDPHLAIYGGRVILDFPGSVFSPTYRASEPHCTGSSYRPHVYSFPFAFCQSSKTKRPTVGFTQSQSRKGLAWGNGGASAELPLRSGSDDQAQKEESQDGLPLVPRSAKEMYVRRVNPSAL